MPSSIWGTELPAAASRLGCTGALSSVTASVVSDGPGAGTRRLRAVCGDLDLEVLPDRGLDIGQVRFAGVPMAWLSATGFPAAAVFDADGGGWARAFGGGLLTTCGLLNVGPADQSAAGPQPMHGRYTSLSASVTRAEASASAVVIEGVVREVSVFGAHLELRRSITVPLGADAIAVSDVITNRANTPAEPMVLYHLNFGWPFIDAGTTVTSPAATVRARDAAAERAGTSWHRFPETEPTFPEQVFQHELSANGPVQVDITHPRGLRAAVRFDAGALPGLFQWQVAEPGMSVLGIEPARIPTILGRQHARDAGLLRPLGPGESLTLGVEVSFAGSLR